jgi:hypothetical protein
MTLSDAQARLTAIQAAYTRALSVSSYSLPGGPSVTRQPLEVLAAEVVRCQRDVDRLTDAAAGVDSTGYGFATFD